MPGDRTSSDTWSLLAATGAGLLVVAWVGLVTTGASHSTDDGPPLVTDGARYDASPANAGSLALTLPEGSAKPWCLLSDGALVVWPRGSTYDVAAGEVRNRSGACWAASAKASRGVER